ncbi:hypothetical protein ISCGN_025206 [Ixodes scapularis]
MRSEISLLNKRILERLPLATIPRETYAAAAASFASVPGNQSSKSVPGKQPLTSGAVSRSTEITDAAVVSPTTWADCDAPSASTRATGEIHEAGPAGPWIDGDGFTRVQRKGQIPTSSGTAKSNKVLAAPRKQVTKVLFVSRLDPPIVEYSEVRSRLQVIRNKQRTCNNKTSTLPELHEGLQVSTFDTIAHTWSLSVVVKRARLHRSYIIDTDDECVLTRTRVHLRTSPPQAEPVIPIPRSHKLFRQQVTPVPTREAPTKETPGQDVSRSSRQRRRPNIHPRPED